MVRATGTGPFETTAEGRAVIEHAEPGEVVWTDDAGVTCRRWNWRQCTRIQLIEATRRALFIVDAPGPEALATASVAREDLERRLRALDRAGETARRVIPAPGA